MKLIVQRGKCLVALHSCGCLSAIMIVDEGTKAKWVGDFHAVAHERGCVVREVGEAEPTPPTQCGATDCAGATLRAKERAKRKGGKKS